MQQKFYLTNIMRYRDSRGEFFVENMNGLFKSYREASQYLIDEGLEVYASICSFSNEMELYFEFDSALEEGSANGFIHEMSIL